MNTKTLDTFTQLFPLSKTLRFELKPIGKTEEHIRKNKLLEHDIQRAQDYEAVKKLIDSYHKGFIEEALAGLKLDWVSLTEALTESRREKSESAKKKLEKEQATLRKSISDQFSQNKNFKLLFSEKLFKELLPAHLKSIHAPEEAEKAVETFKRFSTYFKGFHENRQNIYSREEISTGIPFRLVHDNFPKFIANLEIYSLLKNKYPDILQAVNRELEYVLTKEGLTLDAIFTVDYYNRLLTQKGIDLFNLLIGGRSDEPGKVKVQGFNETINLYRQQHPDANMKIPKMTLLFKQILSDRESQSFVPTMFEDDKAVQGAIQHFYQQELLAYQHDGKTVNVLVSLATLASKIKSYDLSKIQIEEGMLSEISLALLKGWGTLKAALEPYAKQHFTTKKNQEKFIKSHEFSIADLNAALNYGEKAERIEHFWTAPAENYLFSVEKIYSHAAHVLAKEYTSDNPLREQANDIEALKNFLDAIMAFMRWLKPLLVRTEAERDLAFYAEFEPLYHQLALIVPLYNKVRNYATEKLDKAEKIKLNFENPTLADGWDQNKEDANTSIILLKDQCYYLGVLNAKNKPDIDAAYDDQQEPYYQKMIYKLLPGPNKMLPKVFFSAKGLETFDPPKEILDGYEKGKHKKGDSFDLVFCHRLINYFKLAISQHENWKHFNFQFSETAKYQDISDFYREVQEQGYKITFATIPEQTINKWVEEGQLYLFQLYNKDFATGSTGTPNIHTLYWKQIFSPENLKDVIVKLNGEAELFYRESVIKKPFAHRLGEKLINRRSKDGKPIPEKIYGELFHYVNHGGGLSAQAREWMDRVVVKDVKHEIIKDRRYTQAKFLFHVPLTINFKVRGEYLNERAKAFLKDNPHVNILGIDRGERHLLYLTVINQKGEILEQRSLNTVKDTDYQEKLVQREGERDEARKSWQSIGKIADLKEGYLSQVIHEIATLMVEKNAMIVLEDLNFGFKRGRFKVERQVYQKFEKTLIDKLNYLVFKDRTVSAPGGVLNGYQFTDKFTAFKDIGKQTGLLFYVPAAYTSKIDPTTGFANLLNLNYDTEKKSRELFEKSFDFIRYNSKEDYFEFGVNYTRADVHVTDFTGKWTVSTTNEKRFSYHPSTKVTDVVMVTEKLKELFEKQGIPYQSGKNFQSEIVTTTAGADFFKTLIWLLKLVMQMRCSNTETGEDYILSPVKNALDHFYDSRKADKTLPRDADANGAYHIALKGLYLLREVLAKDSRDLKISHPDWLAFAQKRLLK